MGRVGVKAAPTLPTVQHTNHLNDEFYEGEFVHEVTVRRSNLKSSPVRRACRVFIWQRNGSGRPR